MLKANSFNNPSLGSSLANLFLSASGITSMVKSGTANKSLKPQLSKIYTNQVRSAASSPDMWGESANLLEAVITDNNEVVVRATGSDEDIYSASMLEYGTPDRPPRAIMRSYSISLTEDFKQVIKDFNL